MSACSAAFAPRGPQHDRAKPKADSPAETPSAEKGVPRFLDRAAPRFEVGAPGDAYEREADAVADAVQHDRPVRLPSSVAAPRYQRQCTECAERVLDERDAPIEDGPLQRRLEDGAAAAPVPGVEAVSGLASAVRPRLERSLKADLRDVRVHSGPAASVLAHALGAKAFTRGRDIWLGVDQRAEDLGLMAHEVTHVLQQTGGPARIGAPPRPALQDQDEEGLEAKPESDKPKQSAGDDDGEDGADAPDGAGAGEGGEEGGRDLRAAGLAIRGSASGDSLDGHLRLSMERSFGADFGGVRIHDDDAAHRASDLLGADAFALGQNIYFGRGRYSPDSPGGRHLVAHELAHVEQNRRAGPAVLDPHSAAPALSRAGAPAEAEAESAADAVAQGATASPSSRPAGHIQRKNAFSRALDWGAARLNDAESAVVSGAKAAGKFVGDQLMKLLRAVAPQVADIIDEGPVNFAKRKINEALDAHLPAALGGFSLGEMVDAVSGWLGDAASFVKDLLKGDAKACDAFASMMDKLTQFVTKLIDNPVIKTVTGVLTKVSDFIGKAIKFVAAPVFDELAKVISGAWSVMKKVASTVSGWISKAKQAIGGLWDDLMKALGFDGSSEDGVWAHIKKIGSDIWEGIKAKMAPIIEPMKKVASVLSLLTPMGQVHAIVKYGPKLVKVATWVWNNGLDPSKIREAPEDIRGMLTDLTGGVSGFKGVLRTGLDWFSEKVSSLADAVLDVAGAISGLPLIGYAHGLFDEAKGFLKTLVGDIEKGAKDALAAIEGVATKIWDFISPYKEVIGSLILAIASPPMIPVILGGWAWRALPSCVKVPIINFILDIAIAALEAIPEVPTFGLLWPLLKPGVMAFLGTLRAAEDSVKELISNKIAKIISGASPEFLIGFVKGFATGVWEGITDPFKAIWTVLEGLDSATQYLLSLAGMGEETEAKKAPEPAAPPAAAPATPSVPVAAEAAAPAPEKAYAADPAAALKSGTPMPESTRRLLEKLAAQKAAEKPAAVEEEAAPAATSASEIAPADVPALKERAGAMAGELSPDVETVKGGFWDAVQEYFSGEGMSFDDMVSKLSEAWESAKTKISEGAAWLANQLMGFFKGEGAEGELGDKIGWLTGTIAFQALLDFITAGTWAGAGPVLKGIAKFINWPMEALGEAFKLLKTLGKYLLEGLKSLGNVIKDAAAGAFKTVSKALGNIGERLIAFGEEIIGKFGGKAAKAESKAVSALGKEGAKIAETKVGKQALSEAEEKAAQKLEQQAGKVEPHPTEAPKTGEKIDVDQVPPESAAKREASAAESGHVESDELTPRQARNETDKFREHPESLEGTAPNRKSKAGEHEWREETLPNGECQFCRYSSARVCVETPELRAEEMGKLDEKALGLQREADKQAKAAAEAREKAMAHPSASPADQDLLEKEAADARKRAEEAQKRIDAVKGKRSKAARDEMSSAKAELEKAQGDVKAAEDLLGEKSKALSHAEEQKALATAAQEEAKEAAAKAGRLKDMEKEITDAEKELAELREKWPATRMKPSEVHMKMNQLERDIASKKNALAEGIEAAKGFTPEARETLRAGTPFKGVGGAEKKRAFLDSLPEEAKGPNGTYIDYVTGDALPLSELSPDHVVPVDEIFGMKGFGDLPRSAQQEILDMPQNLRMLERARNESKKATSLMSWLGGKADKVPALPAARRQALADIEAKARADVQAEIAKRLKAMGLK